MLGGLLTKRIRDWGLRGGLAVMDQAAFSGANFVLNVLLARWLGAAGYGVFAIAFALYLLGSGIHNALILEPITVFGTSKYMGSLKSYLIAQVFIHALVCGILATAGITLNLGLRKLDLLDIRLSEAIGAMALFLPLMLLMWLSRRTCYIYGRPDWAFVASLAYAAAILAGAFLVHSLHPDGESAYAFPLMGIAGVVGSLVAYAYLGISSAVVREAALQWKALFLEQWTFGRWIIFAAFTNFAATQMQLLICAFLLGLQAAGTLSAIQNFTLPMMQVVTAITTLGLPIIARENGRSNPAAMRKTSFRISGSLSLVAALYVCVLLLFSSPIERFLYAGAFATYVWLIPIAALIPLITAIESGYALIVRSLRRPVYYAVITSLTAITGTGLGWLFISNWGLAGAVLSLIVVAIVALGTAILFYRSWFLPKFSELPGRAE